MNSRLLISLLLAVTLGSVSQASGFYNPYNGVAQMGMGGFGVAMRSDASSLAYNPALMAFSKRSLQFGIVQGSEQVAYLDERTNTEYYQAAPLVPFQFYAIVGPAYRANWRFGIGAYAPYALHTNWDDNWVGNAIVQKLDYDVFVVSPAFAYKWEDVFSLGIALQWGIGRMGFKYALPFTDDDGRTAQASMRGGGFGFGASVGLFAKPNEYFELGLSYRSGMSFNMQDLTTGFELPNSLTPLIPEVPASFKTATPHSLSAGLLYHATSNFSLGLQATYMRYSDIDSFIIDYSDNPPLLDDYKAALNLQDAYRFALGMEYRINEFGDIRWGLSYQTSSVPEGDLLPLWFNAERLGMSIGGSLHVSEYLSLNGAISYIEEAQRRQLPQDNALDFGGTVKSGSVFYAVDMTIHF